MSTEGIRRFYENARVANQDGSFVVTLDGRTARSPGRRALAAASERLAEAMAAEWAGQDDVLSMETMPLTRLQGRFLDATPEHQAEWTETVLRYARSDLLCYRGEDPALAKRQAALWQPYLDRVGEDVGGRFALTEGIVAIEQPEAVTDGMRRLLEDRSEAERYAARLLTEVTGSAVLAASLLLGGEDPDAVFAASRLDETFQAERWGVDAEAASREAVLRDEFDAIVRFLMLSSYQT